VLQDCEWKLIITKKKARQEKQDEEEIKALEKVLKLVEQGRLQAEGKEVELPGTSNYQNLHDMTSEQAYRRTGKSLCKYLLHMFQCYHHQKWSIDGKQLAWTAAVKRYGEYCVSYQLK